MWVAGADPSPRSIDSQSGRSALAVILNRQQQLALGRLGQLQCAGLAIAQPVAAVQWTQSIPPFAVLLLIALEPQQKMPQAVVRGHELDLTLLAGGAFELATNIQLH